MLAPISLGKPTGRVYYCCPDAKGWCVPPAKGLLSLFSRWPHEPELWAEYEFGAWRLS